MVALVPAQIPNLRPRLPAASLRRSSLPLLATRPHYPLSFCRPFVFILLQNHFPATPLFSHPCKTAGVSPIRFPASTSHRSQATSHVLSYSWSLFSLSLRAFLHSFPLFSIACSLFSQNTRGGGYPRIPIFRLSDPDLPTIRPTA